MRALILLLPLTVAFAGGDSPLEEATRRWKSDSAEEREAASRFVAIHIRRELAPLVRALASDDPEVRHRAQAAIEALLPPRPPQPPEEREPEIAGRQVLIFNNVGGGNGNIQARVVVNARGRMVIMEDAEEVEKLREKGITGMSVDDPVMREQLVLADGRGFAVTAVERRSEADRLGLCDNDILISIDGQPVKQAGDVLKALGKQPSEIVLLRRGKLSKLGGKESEGAPGAGEGK
ncbi:MAG TPA: PDZ domain-containing protein [Planctomycetota bacterium]|nr:PDZ domain-containing protein [Planctomycetota bacterium]